MIGLGLSITQLAVRQLVGQFNPMKLFALGEQGAWYDPSDLTTLFQDAAGTTAVTAVEQPVGLMLDKSRGLVLGPELVVNGGFDDATGWTLGTGWTISGGVASWSSPIGASINRALDVSMTAGRTYSVEVDLDYTTGNGVIIGFNGGGGIDNGPALNTSGRKTFVVRATLNRTGINITGIGTSVLSIDNISVRELPGNHAYQTTSTSRPVLSARVNLLTKTEQFTDAAWTKQDVILTGGAAVDPLWGNTASSLFETATNNFHQVFVGSFPVSSGVGHTVSFYVKANGRTKASIGFVKSTSSFDGFTVFADLAAKTTTVTTAGVGTCTAHGIQEVGNGWFRVFGTGTIGANTTSVVAVQSNSDAGANSYLGDPSKGIYIWGASIVPANQSSLPYQRVNTATDYDAGPAFPRYLRCDGIDDGMVTGTITPGTDKAQVFAGVRKLSNAERGILLEFGPGDTSNGQWQVNAPTGLLSGYGFFSRGTLLAADADSSQSAPSTNVITGLGDISGDRATLRIDGDQAEQSTADQGTGNYLAYPLYLFRRGGTSLPFNGHFYGAVIRFGDNLPIETIQQTEAYMNSKTQAIDWRDITDSSSFRWNSATASPAAE